MQKEKLEWRAYPPLWNGKEYIDKTRALEKGIEAFPSIYIEGAAASGKTTAVRMFLEKHPQTETAVFWMEEELQCPKEFSAKLEAVRRRMEETPVWAVFENLPKELPAEVEQKLVWLVRHLPDGSRVILIGREEVPAALLELLWKQEMKLLPQRTFCLSPEEIRLFAARLGIDMDPSELYEVTGGWAGCVALMLQLSDSAAGHAGGSAPKARELRQRYEVKTYIRQQILDTLSEEEQEIMQLGQMCPWMDEALCREVWGHPPAADVLQGLCRKGLMIWNERLHRWKVAPLFRDTSPREKPEKTGALWKRLGGWYGSRGFLREMVWCLERLNEEEAWKTALELHYHRIPFLDDSFDSAANAMDLLKNEEDTPSFCWLRGVYCWKHGDSDGLKKEIAKLEEILEMGSEREPEQYAQVRECYLNLCFVNPELSLDGWLALVEKWLGNEGREGTLRLFWIQGKTFSCLDGMRDLSGLFACPRKEERRKETIWKTYLGSREWTMYRLARMEYYLETERMDAVPEQDKNLLEQIASGAADEQFPAAYPLSAMYLLCRMQRLHPDVEAERQIRNLESVLLRDDSASRAEAEALSSLYALWRKEPEKLSGWLYHTGNAADPAVTARNFTIFYCRAKGYIFLNQYEKARRILQMLIPYLQGGRHNRFLAEVLFEQAIIHWDMGSRANALRAMVESFAVNGSSRYVGFYGEYGARGGEVLEHYVQWLKKNLPEGWRSKKKYHYGNVLRMPEADYLEVILRCIRREARGMPQRKQGEQLTMMETVILQHISRGLNNAEICSELNLKLPTVKSHIYSLYQKLGVNRRVQAVIRAKELGIVDKI